MSEFVIDTSVVAKWYLNEENSSDAGKLLNGTYTLHAPLYLLIETDSVLTKRIRRKELNFNTAEWIRQALRQTPILWHPDEPLMNPAFTLAYAIGCSYYDALFVGLAEALNRPLITGDQRLVHALENVSLNHRIKWIGNLNAGESS